MLRGNLLAGLSNKVNDGILCRLKPGMPTLLLILSSILFAQACQAAIEKEIRIDSQPQGTSVYLLKGNKKQLIGQTPLVHKLKFHSEISVIRLRFEKPGHNGLTLQVSASDNQIMADLGLSAIMQDPASLKNPELRRLHSKLKSRITPMLSAVLSKDSNQDLALAEPVALTGRKAATSLVIVLRVGEVAGKLKPETLNRRSIHLNRLWKRLSQEILIPLASEVKAAGGSDRISMKILLDSNQPDFEVKATTKTETTMQCVPGYRTQQVLKYRQVPEYESYSDDYGYHTRLKGYRSESYLDTEQVYDPCFSKTPVTRVVPTTAPSVKFSDLPALVFDLDIKSYAPDRTSEALYEQVNIRLENPKTGKLVRHID